MRRCENTSRLARRSRMSDTAKKAVTMKQYNPHELEPRWQKVWEETGQNKVEEDTSKPKKYVLEMFPYPSGEDRKSVV